VYFKKRRVLFTGEPLVEDGLNGLLRAVGRFIWPSVTQEELARKAAREGLYAVGFLLAVKTIAVVFYAFGYPIFGFTLADSLDVAAFVAVGWGIYKLSRLASVLGLIFYLLEQITVWQTTGQANSWTIPIETA